MSHRKLSAQEPLQLVLDDDPTGVQAVHGVPVVATWDDDALVWAVQQPAGTDFVLTNSRALPGPQAADLTYDIARRALAIASRLGRELVFASRSDSTLRGHFPQETDALVHAWRDERSVDVDGVLPCPAFVEAGRWTAASTHWVDQDGVPMPVGRDPLRAGRDLRFRRLRSPRLGRGAHARTGRGVRRPGDRARRRPRGAERVAAV